MKKERESGRFVAMTYLTGTPSKINNNCLLVSLSLPLPGPFFPRSPALPLSRSPAPPSSLILLPVCLQFIMERLEADL
jgi:hypothetical protein